MSVDSSEKLVSVVIPARNRESTIGRAVDSVCAQSYADLEVLVVDDGSDDDTCARVEERTRADSRVRLLRHESGQGAQSARNTGIQAARGTWVAFLDSDDYWLPGSLEARLNEAARAQAEVVHTNCVIKHAESSMETWELPPLRGRVFAEVLRAPGPMFQGLLVRRDVLLSIGPLDEGIDAYQEWDTAIRLAETHTFGFCSQPTFVYDCSMTGTISKDLRRGATGYAQVVEKHHVDISARLGKDGLVHHYVVLAGMFSSACDARGVIWTLGRLTRTAQGLRSVSAGVRAACSPWSTRVRRKLAGGRGGR